MKSLSQVLFWFGIISIPLSWLAWFFAVPGLAYGWYSALVQYLPVTLRAAKDI